MTHLIEGATWGIGAAIGFTAGVVTLAGLITLLVQCARSGVLRW
jgi:hypothetical protein